MCTCHILSAVYGISVCTCHILSAVYGICVCTYMSHSVCCVRYMCVHVTFCQLCTVYVCTCHILSAVYGISVCVCVPQEALYEEYSDARRDWETERERLRRDNEKLASCRDQVQVYQQQLEVSPLHHMQRRYVHTTHVPFKMLIDAWLRYIPHTYHSRCLLMPG